MPLFKVGVVVTYKRELRDPEGETIRRDLLLKTGYDRVASVRTGKYFEFYVNTNSPEEALSYIKEMCSKLRIFNPIVHVLEVVNIAEDSSN